MVILGTGDAYFGIMIQILLGMYKIVIAWSWKESLATSLKKTVGADNIYYLDNIWDEIKKKKHSHC